MNDSVSVENRNFAVNVVEGALFVAGATFISVQTVLPAMVIQLGGSNLAVGSLGVIAWGGLFLPQVFAARYFESVPWKKPWTIRLGMTQRVLLGIIGLMIFLYGASDPSLTLAVFLLLYALMHVVLGITTPGWIDLVAKVTPVTRRGRLAGYRSSIAGALGFTCSFALVWILDGFRPPLNYAVVFGLAFALQLVSIMVQFRLREVEPGPVIERRSMGVFLRDLPSLLKDHPSFRNFVLSMIFFVLATISITFFPVYALDRFGVDISVVGEFTMVMVAAQVVSAPLVGLLADRSGNKIALVTAGTALLLAAVTALAAPTIGWFFLVFAFLGVNVGSELMARYNIAVEFAPEKRRAIFLSLMNALLAPFYAVGLLGGWLSDLIGYEIVFIVGFLCSVTGILLLICTVTEPRGRVIA